METKDLKKRSALRRSLMAFAILAAPVVSIAGFSGSASAALSSTSAVERCDSATPFFGIRVSATASNMGHQYTVTYKLLPSGSATPAPGGNFSPGTGGSNFDIALPDGTYEVKLTRTNDANDTVTFLSVTVDCDRAATDTFTVDPICEGTPKGISVTLTSRYDDKSPYDLSVSYPGGSTPAPMSFADTDFDEVLPSTTPRTYTATEEFLYGGEGDYVVSIVHRVTGKTVKYQGTLQTVTYDPECPSTSSSSVPGGGYNFNFNFKLPTTTVTPALPSTGSDSSTSLLVIAPVMVLLGAGLILARRRLATV